MPTSLRTHIALAVAAASWTVGSVLAQAPPPEPVCSSSDTLRWTFPAPPAGCGAVTDVTVFASDAEGGPFDPLGAGQDLPDASGTVTAYVLAPGERATAAFFRLRATYAGCGQSALGPVAPVGPLPNTAITSVANGPGGVELTWEAPAGDARVTRFQVYESTGREPLATVTGTSYLAAAPPTLTAYFLGTGDACSSTSLSTEIFSAAEVDVVPDPCAGTLLLTRRLAAAWPRPFAEAEVTVTPVSGGAPTLITVAGDAAEFTLDDPLPEEAYELRVRYVDAAGASTTAPPVRVEPAGVLTSDVVAVTQLTFEEPTGWRAGWRWAPGAEYDEASWRVDGSDADLTAPIPAELSAEPSPTLALGLSVDLDWRAATWQVEATDLCDVRRASAPARPVVAEAELAGSQAALITWTAPLPLGLDVVEYRVERGTAATGYAVVARAAAPAPVTDVLTGVGSREVCYRVVARVAIPEASTRPADGADWASAPVCVARRPRAVLPTGFAPGGGVSPEYRPRLILADGLGYALRIYDRWGKLLFTSEEPLRGWDGSLPSGDPAPPGTYAALVELDDGTGQTERFEALVALIR